MEDGIDWGARDRDVRAVIEKHGWAMSSYHEGGYEFSMWKGQPSFLKRLTGGRQASVNLKKGLIRFTVWQRAYVDEVKEIARDVGYMTRVDIA